MRIDVVTIFPGYLAPLDLSLPGRARERGLLDLRVHDLRDWTDDRHRTVDDTPYGGGAGMVMKPEPWGRALDDLLGEGDPSATVVVPTPAGEVFDQALARELAGRRRLVFACGRYEGIDARVVDHAAALAPVREVSLGDYVLNGGEVAALAITEAVVRLLPGVVGNPESLVEESHEGGLLEAPVHTRPATWRGRAVPDVLLGGDHAAVAAWRHQQAVRRTAARRPDLLPTPVTREGWPTSIAVPADVGELWTLALAAQGAASSSGPAGTIEALRADVERMSVHVLRSGDRIVGSVRCRREGEAWVVDRLVVAPDLVGDPVTSVEEALLDAALARAPGEVSSYRLVAPRDRGRARRLRRRGFAPGPGAVGPEAGPVWQRPAG